MYSQKVNPKFEKSLSSNHLYIMPVLVSAGPPDTNTGITFGCNRRRFDARRNYNAFSVNPCDLYFCWSMLNRNRSLQRPFMASGIENSTFNVNRSILDESRGETSKSCAQASHVTFSMTTPDLWPRNNHSSFPGPSLLKTRENDPTTSAPFPTCFRGHSILPLSTFPSLQTYQYLFLTSQFEPSFSSTPLSLNVFSNKILSSWSIPSLGRGTTRFNHSLPNLWRSYKPLHCFFDLLRRKGR